MCWLYQKELSIIDTWDKRLRSTYGISAEEYLHLLAFQGGVCAVCKKPPGKTRLHVDHDHVSKEIRGLLCWVCNNRVIGRHRHKDYKILLAAANYLEDYPWLSCFTVRLVPKKKRRNKRDKSR